MKRVALATTVMLASLPLAAALPADASAVYNLTASYGRGSYKDAGDQLCVEDTKADGKGVKVVLSWYDNGYHERTVKAPPASGPDPGVCRGQNIADGTQMLLTLSRTDGTGAVSRTVIA